MLEQLVGWAEQREAQQKCLLCMSQVGCAPSFWCVRKNLLRVRMLVLITRYNSWRNKVLQAIETTAIINKNNQLIVNETLPLAENTQVRIIILSESEQTQQDWQNYISTLENTWEDVPYVEEIRQNEVGSIPRDG